MKTSHALDQVVPLAADLNNNKVTPGLLGFVIFAGIAVGLWLLMKNMGKHMKKIDFEEAPEPPKREKRVAAAASVPAPKGPADSGTPPASS